MIERHEGTKPDLVDYETAMKILADIHGREAWSTPRVLAQWVAEIRINCGARYRNFP